MPSYIIKEKQYKKKDLLKIAKNELNDTFSLEELVYKLTLLEKINNGLEDVKAGRVLTEEELEKKITKWQK